MKYIFFFLLCCATLAQDEPIQLHIPTELEVRSLDGASVKKKWFKKNRALPVTPGHHEIVVQYYIIEDINEDDYLTYRSTPVRISFEAKKGQDLKFVFDHPPQEVIESGEPKPIDIRIEPLPKKAPQTEKTKKLARKENPTAKPRDHKSTKAAPRELKKTTTKAVPDTSKKTLAAAPKTNTSSGPGSLQMLKYWWEKADASQRETFLNWVKKSP